MHIPRKTTAVTACMISAFFLGFRATLLIALGIYCLALAAFAVISQRCGRSEHAAL